MLSPSQSRKLAYAMAVADLTPQQKIEIARQATAAENLSNLPTWMQNLLRDHPHR